MSTELGLTTDKNERTPCTSVTSFNGGDKGQCIQLTQLRDVNNADIIHLEKHQVEELIGMLTDWKDDQESEGEALYTWHWVGGGYNQCRATTAEDAIAMGEMGTNLKVDLSTLKRLNSQQAAQYWNAFPMFD